jgi:hypothetical protein
LNKRRIVRKTLRNLLAKLIEKGVVIVEEEKLRRLAEVSGFWRKLYTKLMLLKGKKFNS